MATCNHCGEAVCVRVFASCREAAERGVSNGSPTPGPRFAVAFMNANTGRTVFPGPGGKPVGVFRLALRFTSLSAARRVAAELLRTRPAGWEAVYLTAPRFVPCGVPANVPCG